VQLLAVNPTTPTTPIDRKGPDVTREAPKQRGSPDGSLERRAPKDRVFGWLAFVILAVALGTGVGLKQIDSSNGNVGQAPTADQILTHAGSSKQVPSPR
jgi:hypothetical protein